MKAISNRKLIAALLAAAFAAPLASPAFAQAKDQAESSAKASQSAQAGRDVRASKLIGMDVKNAAGENLGEIKDLVVDVKGERVNYAVLAFGGMMGLGEKLFAYPISTFKSSADGDELVLNVDKEKIKNAPGFERDRWPDFADNRYRGEVDRYFRANAVGATPTGERLMRATELIGKSVDDRQGRDAGEIEDLVVNPASERIRYVVLDYDKTWSPDDKLITLPLAAFSFPDAKGRDLVLNVSRNQVASARTFDEKAWPDLNARSFRREVDAFLTRFRTEQTARGTTDADTSSGSSGNAGSRDSSSERGQTNK